MALKEQLLNDVADAFREGFNESGEDTMYAEQMAIEYLQDERAFIESAAKEYVENNMDAINKIVFG